LLERGWMKANISPYDYHDPTEDIDLPPDDWQEILSRRLNAHLKKAARDQGKTWKPSVKMGKPVKPNKEFIAGPPKTSP
jgi:hypothetical protein